MWISSRLQALCTYGTYDPRTLDAYLVDPEWKNNGREFFFFYQPKVFYKIVNW